MFKHQALLDKIDQFYKIAKREEDLMILQANIGNYIHFSSSERFGISYHQNVHPGNPRGVYGFPLTDTVYQNIINNTPNFHEFSTGAKYIYVFGVSGNILDMDTLNFPKILNDIRTFILNTYSDRLKQIDAWYLQSMVSPSTYLALPSGRNLMKFLWDMFGTLHIFKNEHSAVNVIIRGIGYDAMKTSNNGFDDGIKSEIVVLNPGAVNLIAKVNNPMLTREDIKQNEILYNPKLNEKYLKEQQA